MNVESLEQLMTWLQERKCACLQAFDAFDGDEYYGGKCVAYDEIINRLVLEGAGQ